MSDTTRPPAEPSRELPPPPPSRTKDQAVWVGLFLVLGLVAVLIALFTLTDAALFRGRYIVTTSVDNAGGIRKGDPVQMRGVNIGRVQRFMIQEQGVDIRLELEGEYDVPKDSHVELQALGLLGGMVAEVVPGKSKEVLHNGDRIPGQRTPGAMDSADEIASKAEKVLGRVETLLSDETIKNVAGTTRNTEASSRQLRVLMGDLSAAVTEQRKELQTLTASLRRSSASLEKVVGAPELDRTMKRLDTLTERMDGVTQTLDRSSKSLESVMGRMDRGEGTLGKLSKDEDLYKNLNQAATSISQATVNINKLTEEIRRDPKKYLTIQMKVF
jgi:phospholipid/cholesterol/gamma-HCH transport system substrate-binding protein